MTYAAQKRGGEYVCAVCRDRAAEGFTFCKPCAASYDKFAAERSIHEIVTWAAKRAIRFERKRQRALADKLSALQNSEAHK